MRHLTGLSVAHLYPLGLWLLPPLHYARRLDLIINGQSEALRLLTGLTLGLLTWGVALAVLRHGARARLATAAAAVWLFPYAFVGRDVPTTAPNAIALEPWLGWVAVWTVTVAGFTISAMIWSRALPVETFLATTIAVLLAFPVSDLVRREVAWLRVRQAYASHPAAQQLRAALESSRPIASAEQGPLPHVSRRPPSAGEQEPLPDLYYVILDGYAGSPALREFYDYGNEAFLDGLTQRGFFVTENSYSNYMQTVLALSAALRMDYLDFVPEIVPGGSEDRRLIHALLKRHRLGEYLQARGYRYIHVSSSWGPTAASPLADVVLERPWPQRMRRFTGEVLSESAVAPLGEALLRQSQREAIRFVLHSLRQLAAAAPDRQPRFVLAHVLAPHPPYVLDAEGGPVDYTSPYLSADIWYDRHGYLQQLEFVNREILGWLDQLLNSASRPPVIVLQGDHGTASTRTWQADDPSFVRERLSILSAYLLPCHGEGPDRSISPVNAFRLVLRSCLGEELELLEERHFFSAYTRPFEFVEVTELIRPDDVIASYGPR